MFQYPYGDTQQLNLDWLMEQWQETKASIDGSLQGEIDRVEAAMTDLLTARDQAVAAKTAAETAATSASGYAGTASGAASTATAQATAAAASAALAGSKASDAQTAETNAALQATAAANSAAAAAVSKTNAANSETAAAASSSAAAGNALYAEGMAKGTQNGTPVASGSPYYENNADYWAGQAANASNYAETCAYYAEAMAKGTVNGTPVSSGEVGYEDNASYYKDQAAAQAAAAAASAASADGTNAQKMIAAPEEASSTASAAHAAGTYFRYNSKLYKATQDIAIGGTITPNTNCVEDTVCAELTAQSEQIVDITNCMQLNLVPYACNGADDNILNVKQNGNVITINGTSNATSTQANTKILLTDHIHTWNAVTTPAGDDVYTVPLINGHTYKLKATILSGTRDAGSGTGNIMVRVYDSTPTQLISITIALSDTEAYNTFVATSNKIQIRAFVNRLMTLTNVKISIELSDVTLATELDNKQDELTFDTRQTKDSTNPVTSGGLYNYTFNAKSTSGITDLNDLSAETSVGNYSWGTSTHPANTPSELDGKGFQLLVFIPLGATARTTQVIIPSSADANIMYRNRITTGWRDWSTLVKVGDPTKYWCYGKTVNWIGDSIISGGDFDELVCDALGMTGNDYGISGSTIALASDGTDTRNAVVARYSSMSDDADIIAVSAGTNDWMYAWCPIGDMDSTTNNTFYGAMKNLCEGLMTKYPDKVIFFSTPIKRAKAFADGNGGTYTADGVDTTPSSKNKYGKTLMDYCDIIKEVCGYYGIPVLDMNRESGLNPSIAAQSSLFTDKTHPSATGKRIMARRVAGWLTQLAYTIST